MRKLNQPIKFSLVVATILINLLLFQIQIHTCQNAKAKEVEEHLNMGIKFLGSGQLAEALNQFHSAIDLDPTNYMSYYRRGTVLLAMGKFKQALGDLNQVVQLKPDFTSARMQRANVQTKQGEFASAIKDYEEIIKNDQTNSEAKTKLDKIFSILNDLGVAKQHMASRNYGPAIDILSQLLETCPWSTELHEFRSDCYLNLGELNKAILDINALAKLIPDNTKAYYLLSELHYKLGNAELALNDIRECLRLDPDHKKCSTYYKNLRKLAKFLDNMKKAHDEQRYDECLTNAQQVYNHDKNANIFRLKAQSHMCSCNSKAKKTKEAIEICTLLIKTTPNDAESYFNRAQAYIADELYEAAQQDCQKAHELEQSQRTQECNDKINKLIKQSKKRDYYKILGVKRSADKKAIMKAYRKQANQWHPDKFQANTPEREAAQKKFIDIAAAKEVLSDPEKRAKFDNGEDPLDAEEQANQGGHGFNPFGQGFNPFGQGFNHGGGGGGYQFKFKFN